MKKILKETLNQNLLLNNSTLVIQTFGNLSIRIDKNKIAIKPSGVNLNNINIDEISVVTLDGEHISGLKPSVDTPTHTHLYKTYIELGAIVHTHSIYASAWAQSLNNIPPLGTTHADFILGDLPCTRPLSKNEFANNYEKNTGVVIEETIIENKLNVMDIPGILVGNHGVFSWGVNSKKALENAEAIEYIAKLAYLTKNLDKNVKDIDSQLNSFHFFRKHGPNNYYGQ